MIQQLLTLTVVVALCAALGEAASLFRRRHPRAPTHERQERSLPDFVGWGCPDLKCPEVHIDCQLMEVIAFRYEGGECLGCPYCIDVPADFYDETREKRSLPEVEDMDEVLPLDFRSHRVARRAAQLKRPIIQNELCEHVTCPVSPPGGSCHHPGMLDGYLRDQKCISCPACLDHQSQQ